MIAGFQLDRFRVIFAKRQNLLNCLAVSACLSLALVAGAGMPVAHAQQEEGGAQIRTLPPAYDRQMMRLAEILGSLHYLRTLCKAADDTSWRDEMESLLEKEQPTEARRTQLIARFNRGFRGFREIYRECTPSAAEAANRYRRQGIRLAAEIPGRYGN